MVGHGFRQVKLLFDYGSHATQNIAIIRYTVRVSIRTVRQTERIGPSQAAKGYLLREAAKIQAKIARQRTDDARKWAKNIVSHHDKIAVENFRPKFLAKTSMARKAGCQTSEPRRGRRSSLSLESPSLSSGRIQFLALTPNG